MKVYKPIFLLLISFYLKTLAVPAYCQDATDKDEEKGQFSMEIQIRPRAEFRNGAFTLRTEESEPAFFISQRSRLSAYYSKSKLKIGFGLQNIRVWGSSPQITITEGNNTMVNEAWLAYQFTSELQIKAGRQALVYDDERIIGGLDWHQAGRWHDVLLTEYTPGDWKIHLALGYNQDRENILNNDYSAPGNHYKSIQMLWVGKPLGDRYKASFLALNTGFEDTTSNNQNFMYTLGGNFYKTNGKLRFTSTFYYQAGKTFNDLDVNAFMGAFYGSLAIANGLGVLFGTDYLSGDSYFIDENETGGETNSFNPLYGTHHKFYGYMDYFYVISPHRNTGLWDKYAGLTWKATNKTNLRLAGHFFNSAGNIGLTDDVQYGTYLGTEIDLTFAVKISEQLSINGGYSQMFATNSMETLKGGDSDLSQNWVWLMVSARPEIF